ncbi:MAG: ATP-binding protein [Brotaphodocola sp.]
MISRRYRNRYIGDFMKELKLVEGRNTGIPTILRAMETNGSQLPIFETDAERTYFTVILPVHNTFLHAGVPEMQTPGKPKSRRSIEEIQRLILEILDRAGNLSTSELAAAMNYTIVTAAVIKAVKKLMAREKWCILIRSILVPVNDPTRGKAKLFRTAARRSKFRQRQFLPLSFFNVLCYDENGKRRERKMKKTIGWILIILGGFFCIDGVMCIPAALTADDIALGERILILICFIVLAISGGLICWKGFKIKAGETKRNISHGKSPMPAAGKIHEISKRYYDSHKNQISPVITERRNGFVHQYHILMFQCDECQKYFEYHDDLRLRPFVEYNNKTYCRKCWEKKQHELYELCPECGKPLSVFERRNQYKGKCRDCWIKTIAKLREKYREYQILLEYQLKEQGIALNPTYTDGLDETGRPSHSIKNKKIDMLPLRDNEYALYLFDVGDGVFAFPDNGIGLRYINAPSNQNFCEVSGSHDRLLAAGTDGEAIYLLTGKGKLFITNPDISEDKNNNNTGGVQLIDLLSLCLKTAEDIFSEKQIEDAVTAFCSHGIVSVDDKIYYDPAAQKFFRVAVDGNYYHGYDVDYLLMSKEEVITWHTRFHFSIDSFVDACRAGEIPMLVILSRLPFKEGPYSPPDNFGYGVHFV